MADTSSSPDRQPLYHEVSPTISFVTKIIGLTATVMAVLAFIFCLVKGPGNTTFYLLACNLILSAVVSLVNAYWYRKGDLGGDKYWYIIFMCAVVIFQCLTTDVYVFNMESVKPEPFSTTVAPTTPHTA